MVKSLKGLSLCSKEAQMSQSLHVCKICGKEFATPKALCGHQRIHSGKSNNRLEDENGMQQIWGLKDSRVCSIANETAIESETVDPLRRGYKATSSLSLKESSSFMTETEEHEMSEAAMSLVMFSGVIKNLSPGDFAMDFELESIIHCVESKQEFSEKSTTCSDAVAEALPSPSFQTKPESKSIYKCKICGKSFGSFQALGGHQTLHRSTKDQTASKRTTFEDGKSLSGSSEAKKTVFEVSQEEVIELSNTTVKEH